MCDYSRKDMYSFTRRFYYLLRNHSDRIEFKKLYCGTCGKYNYESGEILIDYRRDIISTLVHEALHKWHPDWSETNVLKHESRIMNALTSRQIKNILKIIGENI